MSIKRSGLIYDFNWEKSSGEAIVAITRAAKFAYHTTKILGSSLIVAGLAGFIFTLQPVVSSEFSYRLGELTGQHARQEQFEQRVVEASVQKQEEAQKLAQELGMPNTYFSIYIPKIGAKAPIVENVNAGSQKEYMTALKEGVAHASGSVFPGMEGATYLFAHSSDAPWAGIQYNTVFYLLRELEAGGEENKPLGGGLVEKAPGDEIYIFFLDKLYKYQVTEKHVVDTGDISWLTKAREGKERLILQTCWPPGTAWKRLVVVAEPVEE